MVFTKDPVYNRDCIYRYFESFCRAAGFPAQSVEISAERMDELSIQLAAEPALRDKMSPFKIAGIFSVELCRHSPIRSKFPNPKFSQFDPNAVLAYFYSVDGMTNAVCERKGITTRIPHRAKVSAHFFREFVATISECRSRRDGNLVALIYEGIVYQFNHDICYGHDL